MLAQREVNSSHQFSIDETCTAEVVDVRYQIVVAVRFLSDFARCAYAVNKINKML